MNSMRNPDEPFDPAEDEPAGLRARIASQAEEAIGRLADEAP